LGVGANLTANLVPREIVSEFADTAKPQILAEDFTDGFGLGLIDHQAMVDAVITERDAASHPHALSFGSGNLVPNSLAGDFPFELSE
jgi:hypothetical protein